jgi:hypothetical protein
MGQKTHAANEPKAFVLAHVMVERFGDQYGGGDEGGHGCGGCGV